MSIYRILGISNLILIICYGILKLWALKVYSKFIADAAIFFDIDISGLQNFLISFSQSANLHNYHLGWIIYYPTYILLHLSFIYLLFRNQKKVKMRLLIGLIVLVFVLIGVSVIGKILEITLIYEVFYYTFKQLFGLPFILLAIEGGKILYNDIVKLSDKEK